MICVVDQIVQLVFEKPNRQEVRLAAKVGQDDQYFYCWCETDHQDDAMIVCSNTECTSGCWFHFDCIEPPIDMDHLPDEWVCSPECKAAISG